LGFNYASVAASSPQRVKPKYMLHLSLWWRGEEAISKKNFGRGFLSKKIGASSSETTAYY